MSAVATVDLDVFRSNLRLLGDIAAPTSVMAMLKADAYGHGMLQLARPALEAGASWLGVLEISEGLRLRDAGIDAPLFAWLHGSGADFAAAAGRHIDVGISTEDELRAALTARPTVPLQVHLKIDTGLHRNGATEREWPGLLDAAMAGENAGALRIRGIWSHLADASVADDEEALRRFREAIAVAAARGVHPELIHLAASSAGIRMPEARFDIVRFGIAAYGVSPFDDRSAADIGVVPTMTLATAVAEGNGHTARIAAGWADGLPARAAHAASVWVRGHRHPLAEIGVDSSVIVEAAGLQTGDPVIVFGPGLRGEPTPTEWAEWAGTIGDEILTGVPVRVPRRYVEAGDGRIEQPL
ncbi:MAG TPA: alanine racemase [Humibacter sp.]|nr:alanine racemase [Humibacter sp.]